MFGLQPLVDVVRRAGVFKRKKTSLEVKGPCCSAMLCRFILRGVAKAIGNISYVSGEDRA